MRSIVSITKLIKESIDYPVSIKALLSRRDNIYIIRRDAPKAGLFSYFQTVLGGIAYAENRGMVPVIDMQNYSNPYLRPQEIGKINAWEYFFHQPTSLTLEKALSSKNVILGRKAPTYHFPRATSSLFYNRNGELDYWRALCKKYITIDERILERVQIEMRMFLNKRVLGVCCRGTDYVALKTPKHPIQPSVDLVIKKVKEALAQQNFNAVYLSTEDKNIMNVFSAEFGSSMFSLKREYVDYIPDESKPLADYHIIRSNDKYLLGADYLVQILLLRECQGLITSMTSGTVGLMCLSDEYDYLYVFDLGYYK